MKVIATIRKSNSLVYIRLRDGREIDWKVSTGIRVEPMYFDPTIPGYKDVPEVPKEVRESTNKKLIDVIAHIKDEYVNGCDLLWFTDEVKNFVHPDNSPKKRGRRSKKLTEFFDIFEDYIAKEKPVHENATGIIAIGRRLRRYEAWRQQMEGNEEFKLTLKDFGRDMLDDFLHYHYNEHDYFCHYPEFYQQFTLYRRTIVPSSKNSISSCCQRLKAFLNWTVKNGYDTDLTFRDIPTEQRIYGTPYYLSIEERDQLYEYDFSYVPQIDLVRDIFVFQCFVGCRQGDLFRLTRDNIKDGWLEYVPGKNLANNRSELVRVLLADKALAIIAKYEGLGKRLFPHFDKHGYGSYIRCCLQMAGITRMVTILNPLTREEEQHPLYEVATTHTARKTFVGNL